ncbi:hypothetical protein Ahy_A05g025407 [Arachis hypogaea]|uniref:Uncharacterized protein n=1 Tax=Arachis hypogaea TaxID=3818 RepID=A0A445D8L6_ARAHY|nr:hypothetical protein Ahy_A05g025407 [Arachis hypogaea]
MISEDPPSVETENRNGKNQDSSGGNQGNQISPDFGPWMLVKRKNPQSGKMGPFNKVGSQGSEKGLKPNPKMIIKNPTFSPEASKSIVTVSPTKKSRETNDMEGVVMEYMRKLQREQNEAFVAMKQIATGREDFVVRNNPLLMNASSSNSHMEIEAVRSPGKDLDRPPDESMIDSGGKKIKERDLSLGKQNGKSGVRVSYPGVTLSLVTPLSFFLLVIMNVIYWNCRGASSKFFHSLIRDLRKEYSANFTILLEPQISGSRGVRIRNNIGFDSSFIVEANGRSGGIWCLWDSGTLVLGRLMSWIIIARWCISRLLVVTRPPGSYLRCMVAPIALTEESFGAICDPWRVILPFLGVF